MGLLEKQEKKGFTLAELLIALAILGVIAAFTIPKILEAQQTSQNNARFKEALSTIANAFQLHKTQGRLTVDTTFQDLTQYMNYVAVQTSGGIDNLQGAGGSILCTATTPCLRFHDGSLLHISSTIPKFTSLGNKDSLRVYYDPDGRSDGIACSASIYIYANGRIRTLGTIESNTCYTGICSLNPDPTREPTWLSW